MSRVRVVAAAVVGAVGAVALAVAALASFAPGVLARLPVEPVTAALDAFGGRALVGVVGGAVVTLAWRFAGSGGRVRTDDTLDATRRTPPETVAVDPLTITGGGVERAYQQAIEAGDPAAVAEPLRTRAVAVEQAAGVDRETAERRVAEGTWTDDRLAASVVGSNVRIPVLARLRAWLDPAAETDRRLTRVVAALESRHEEGAR